MCLPQAEETYIANVTKFFSNVTNGQLVDGVDTFYKDYRNRSIRVPNALWRVVMQIAGTPQDQLDQMIEDFRKTASSE